MTMNRAVALLSFALVATIAEAEELYHVSIDWGKTIAVSKLSPSVYVVNSPMMRRNSPIHDPVYKGLQDLGVD